jgi:hypothetical protein
VIALGVDFESGCEDLVCAKIREAFMPPLVEDMRTAFSEGAIAHMAGSTR